MAAGEVLGLKNGGPVIIFCHICCFSCASSQMSFLKGILNCQLIFTLIHNIKCEICMTEYESE